MPRDLQIILLDVSYLTLLVQRLGQQTTKLLVATVSSRFYWKFVRTTLLGSLAVTLFVALDTT